MPLTTSKHGLRYPHHHQGSSIISLVLPPLLLTLFLSQVQHIPCVTATVKINLEQYPQGFESFGTEFPSQPANFGTTFEQAVEYNADLFMPITDQYLCRDSLNRALVGREILEAFGLNVDAPLLDQDDEELERILVDHSLTEEDQSRLLRIVQREENETVETKPSSSLRRRRQQASIAPLPIALLVSRGKCSFEAKARGAMALDDYFKKIFHGESPIDIKYVIVHNDVVGDNNPILMAGPSTGIDVGMTFVTTAVGYKLKTLLLKVALDQQASPFLQERTIVNVFSDQSDHAIPYKLMKFPITIVNHLGENNGQGVRSSSSRSKKDNFYWIRFVLFAMLIITPFLRGAFLWYKAGGRIRLRRTRRGCIYGIRVVRPRQRWVNVGWRTPAHVDENAHGNGDKMTEEEVMALPEIVYGGNCDEEGGEEEEARRGSFKLVAAPDGQSTEASQAAVTIIASNTTGAGDPEVAQTEKMMTTCTMCSICIDEFEPGEKLRLLPKCHHAFHTDCILPWLTERQGCCPLCKTTVLGDATAESSPDESIEMVAMEGATLPSSSIDEAESNQTRREVTAESPRNVANVGANTQRAPSLDTFEDEIAGGNAQEGTVGVTAISGGGATALTAISANERTSNDNDEESRNPSNAAATTEGDGNSINDVSNDANDGTSMNNVPSEKGNTTFETNPYDEGDGTPTNQVLREEGDSSLILNPDEQLNNDKKNEAATLNNGDAAELENSNTEEGDEIVGNNGANDSSRSNDNQEVLTTTSVDDRS